MGLINYKISGDDNEAFRVIENWDQKERQAKFIVNSAKVFTFFGYNYVLPLWDNLLSDFFSTLPFQLKLDKNLYDHVLKEYFFKELNLNFPGEINPTPYIKSRQRIKERIKGLLPYKVKNLFINHQSPFLYDQISKVLLMDIDAGLLINPRQSNYYNSYIAQWYLYSTRDMLNIK
jgi:asparagine synthase (glutamine-hydrolysing)